MEYGCHACNCQKPLPPGATFCPYCGAKFNRPVPGGSEGDSIVTCGRCGGDGVDPESRGFRKDVCRTCGGAGQVRI